LDASISANKDRRYMSIWKKDFGLAKGKSILIQSNPSADGLDGIIAGRISLPEPVEGLGKARLVRFRCVGAV
jgi:hypothetical protein